MPGRLKKYIRTSFFGLVTLPVLSLACSLTPEPQKPLSCDEKHALAEDYWQLSLTSNTTPGFEEDILPILSSTSDGRVYKCTVCHSKYNEIDVTKQQIDKILTAIVSQDRRMPPDDVGNSISKSDRALLIAWKNAGFPLTRQTADTNNSGSSDRTNSTSPTNTSPTDTENSFGNAGSNNQQRTNTSARNPDGSCRY